MKVFVEGSWSPGPCLLPGAGISSSAGAQAPLMNTCKDPLDSHAEAGRGSDPPATGLALLLTGASMGTDSTAQPCPSHEVGVCSLGVNRARHRGHRMVLTQLPEGLCSPLDYTLSEPWGSALSSPMRKELYLEVSGVDSGWEREAEASRMR